MYVVVDHRETVTTGYTAGFAREGFASLGLCSNEFKDWLTSASDQDLDAVQGFVIGEVDGRMTFPDIIRGHSRAPIIALSEERSLEHTLELFTAGIDDVVRKPIHVREIVARLDAVWRRANAVEKPSNSGRLQVFFNGRDPEIDGEALQLPRRERHILEYLVKNSGRRVTKTQLFNAIYGVFNEDLDETVIEGHMSKLRKKLRQRLDHDVIDAKRFIGYRFVG
mgnify:CR=1 FL=1